MDKESTVTVKYMYERIHTIMDNEYRDTDYDLSRLLDELARNYKIDTGTTIRSK